MKQVKYSAPAVSTSAKPGLGGSGYAAATESTNKDAAAPVPVKQQMLPAEIAELVKGLEGHIKKEKEESSEVAKYSQRTLNKIKENASSLEILIRSLKVYFFLLKNFVNVRFFKSHFSVKFTTRKLNCRKIMSNGFKIAKKCRNGPADK